MKFQIRLNLLLLLAMMWSVDSLAQWNIIAGYDLSTIRETKFNSIINDFNVDAEENYSRELKEVKVLNGFIVGARYGEEFGAGELTYTKRFTRRIGDSYSVKDNAGIPENVDMDVYYDIQSISLNMEFGRVLRLGGSIDYNIYTNEVNYLDADRVKDFRSKDIVWGSKVFLGVHLANTSQVSFSVRAYYQWLWSYHDISEFETQFLDTPECNYCQEKPYTFGLSFIINNAFGR